MKKTIQSLGRHDEAYRPIVDKINKAAYRAFAEAGLPIPEYLEDTLLSVSFDMVDEVVYRVQEIERREA